MINAVGLPEEEDLNDIGMNSKKVVVHMECDGKESWVRPLGEVWPTQKADQ